MIMANVHSPNSFSACTGFFISVHECNFNSLIKDYKEITLLVNISVILIIQDIVILVSLQNYLGL